MAILLCVIMAMTGCGLLKKANQETVAHITIEEPDTLAVPETQEEVITANILAVGDDLIHSGIFNSGRNSDGTWSYDHLYQYVKDDVSAADLAIVNQETILITDHNNLSGYPSFGSPVEIADALVNTGFDVVLHATNHTFDKGLTGVNDTLNYWATKFPQITVLGIHGSQEDADTIKVVDCNGIKIAMLNYTYSLNGYSLPADQQYLVDILDRENVRAAIAQAKEISDMVIFFGHMGNEYVYEPSEYSKEWVNFLLEQGVDIAINSHPHVLEPYTMLQREDGHQMLVYYSMGNFISTQDAVPRLIGGMAKMTVEKRTVDGVSTVSVVDYNLEPVVAHWNHNTGDYAVYKLSDYTNELAAAHGIHGVSSETFTVESLQALFDQIMSTEVTPATGVLPEGGFRAE